MWGKAQTKDLSHLRAKVGRSANQKLESGPEVKRPVIPSGG